MRPRHDRTTDRRQGSPPPPPPPPPAPTQKNPCRPLAEGKSAITTLQSQLTAFTRPHWARSVSMGTGRQKGTAYFWGLFSHRAALALPSMPDLCTLWRHLAWHGMVCRGFRRWPRLHHNSCNVRAALAQVLLTPRQPAICAGRRTPRNVHVGEGRAVPSRGEGGSPRKRLHVA
jgi:hypothetical protein